MRPKLSTVVFDQTNNVAAVPNLSTTFTTREALSTRIAGHVQPLMRRRPFTIEWAGESDGAIVSTRAADKAKRVLIRFKVKPGVLL